MGLDIGSTVGNAANGALGAAMGLVLEHHEDKRQLAQQGKLQAQQIQGQKEMTDYNMSKQLEMWKNTSYPAQMEMLKQAGLNPALMYGEGGGGGTTTGSANGNVTGGTAQTGAGTAAAMGMEMMQLQLMNAQKQNIEADTANKQADTANKPLQGQNIQASTASITQGIENQKTRQRLEELQAQAEQLNVNYEGASLTDRLDLITQLARKATGEATTALVQGNVDEETKRTKVNMIKAEYIGQLLQNTLTSAQTGYTNQKTTESKSNVMLNAQEYRTKAQNIMLEWDKLSNEDQKIQVLKTQLGLQDAPESVIKDVLSHVDILLGKIPGQKGYTPPF